MTPSSRGLLRGDRGGVGPGPGDELPVRAHQGRRCDEEPASALSAEQSGQGGQRCDRPWSTEAVPAGGVALPAGWRSAAISASFSSGEGRSRRRSESRGTTKNVTGQLMIADGAREQTGCSEGGS